MSSVTIFHNPNCSTSRHAVEAAASLGVDADVVQYLKQPLDEAQLHELIAILEMCVKAAMRQARRAPTAHGFPRSIRFRSPSGM